jgi:hypothetical protein
MGSTQYLPFSSRVSLAISFFTIFAFFMMTPPHSSRRFYEYNEFIATIYLLANSG